MVIGSSLAWFNAITRYFHIFSIADGSDIAHFSVK